MRDQPIHRYRVSENAFYEAYQLDSREHIIRIKEPGTGEPGINLRALVTGQGPSLLFIHGAPGAGAMWAPLVSCLPEYQCIILDRPGCGLSDPLGYKHLTKKRLTKLIVLIIDQVLRHFNLDMISVVASSFGGYLAMLYALEKPDKINKLVLEGSPAMVESSRIPFFMKMMLTPGIKWMAPKLPITKFIFRKIMKEMGHGYSLDLQIIPGAFIDWYVSLFNHTATQKNDIALISNAVPGGKLNTEFVLYDHEIERVCLPVLWLWGNDDAFAGPGVGQRIHSKMKNSSILFFENSGHLPWLDQPERHAAVIKSFFQTLLRRV